ncbi:MAG: hypothetical protein ACRDF4_04520 [Rhabdochlamydiaceae bacterium]
MKSKQIPCIIPECKVKISLPSTLPSPDYVNLYYLQKIVEHFSKHHPSKWKYILILS